MKVCVTVQGASLNGFLTIDPTAQPNQTDRVLCQNPTDISDLIDNNECSEFICDQLLDYLPAPARQPALNNYLTKIAHGGIITVIGLCPLETTRLIHRGQIAGLQQINDVVYGNPVNRKSWSTTNDVIGFVMSTGQFDVDNLKYDGLRYCLSFRRK